jgi:hydrogenase nickel incorporation protein HypA/HybF
VISFRVSAEVSRVHELGITRNIVAIAAEAAGNRHVTTITVEIGKLSGIVADAVAFCFDMVAAGTQVEGSRLQICEINGLARCLECGNEFATPTLLTPCSCGSRQLLRLRGEELNVKSIEIQEHA